MKTLVTSLMEFLAGSLVLGLAIFGIANLPGFVDPYAAGTISTRVGLSLVNPFAKTLIVIDFAFASWAIGSGLRAAARRLKHRKATVGPPASRLRRFQNTLAVTLFIVQGLIVCILKPDVRGRVSLSTAYPAGDQPSGPWGMAYVASDTWMTVFACGAVAAAICFSIDVLVRRWNGESKNAT